MEREDWRMTGLRLHLDGTAADAAADELAAFFEAEFGRRPARLPAAGPGETGRKTDPVAIAALVLALPSAMLAAMDLAERIRLREKIARLIDLARRLKRDRGTAVRVETAAGLQDLAALDPDRVLALAPPGEADKP
jgi:hypothetical protein